MRTLIPLLASFEETASPIPDAPPVTMALNADLSVVDDKLRHNDARIASRTLTGRDTCFSNIVGVNFLGTAVY